MNIPNKLVHRVIIRAISLSGFYRGHLIDNNWIQLTPVPYSVHPVLHSSQNSFYFQPLCRSLPQNYYFLGILDLIQEKIHLL